MFADQPIRTYQDLLRAYQNGGEYEFEEACDWMISDGNTAAISRLIREVPPLSNMVWLLLAAVEAGRETLVSDLLKAGARVDATDESGMTPLMIAAQEGNLSIVRVLIEGGADPNILVEDSTPEIDWDKRGRSALYRAISQGHSKVADLLAPLTDSWLRIRAEFAMPVRLGPADEALDRAAVAGDVRAIQTAINAGADVKNRTGSELRTALHAAAEFGQVDAAMFLIEAGAAVDARDQEGRTPLWRASHRGHASIVKLLLSNHADPDGRDFIAEETPLIKGVMSNCPRIVLLLLAAGANPHAAGTDGLSSFDHAAYEDVPAARDVLQSYFDNG